MVGVSVKISGWPVFWAATLGLALMAGTMVIADPGPDGIRMAIRATARTSLAFFLLAFLASSLARLFPSALTRWLRANRRQLGLSFAMSHFIHLMAIVALARGFPETFWSLSNPASIVVGGTGYVVIALLAATSFDAAVRWLGPRRWGILHTIGVWSIWASFMATNGKRIPTQSVWYALPIALLLIALAIRIAARRRT